MSAHATCETDRQRHRCLRTAWGGAAAAALALSLVASAASAAEALFDDFAGSGLSNWTLYGSPLPQWASSAYDRTGVFDNNGDPNYDSGGFSKTLVGSTEGMTIESEVYLDFADLGGCWADAQIGLTRDADPSTSEQGFSGGHGIWFNLSAVGDACWGAPAEYRRKAWFFGGIVAEDESTEGMPEYTFDADAYANGWHRLRIEVGSDRSVRFHVDDTLLWTSTKKLHASLLEGRNVVLGSRSSGSAGKAYHDWVRVSYGSVTAPPLTLTVTDATDSSVTLSWTAANLQRFHHYEVRRSVTSDFGVPSSVGLIGIPAGFLLLAISGALIRSRRRRATLFLALGAAAVVIPGAVLADPDDWFLAATVGDESSRTYTDTSVEAQMTYFYKVLAFDADGSFQTSNEAQVTPGAEPAAIGDGTTDATGSVTLTLATPGGRRAGEVTCTTRDGSGNPVSGAKCYAALTARQLIVTAYDPSSERFPSTVRLSSDELRESFAANRVIQVALILMKVAAVGTTAFHVYEAVDVWHDFDWDSGIYRVCARADLHTIADELRGMAISAAMSGVAGRVAPEVARTLHLGVEDAKAGIAFLVDKGTDAIVEEMVQAGFQEDQYYGKCWVYAPGEERPLRIEILEAQPVDHDPVVSRVAVAGFAGQIPLTFRIYDAVSPTATVEIRYAWGWSWWPTRQCPVLSATSHGHIVQDPGVSPPQICWVKDIPIEAPYTTVTVWINTAATFPGTVKEDLWLEVRPWDERGSLGEGEKSFSSPFTIDNTGATDTTPPSVAFSDPSDGASVTGLVRVAADASDNTGINSVEFYYNAGGGDQAIASDVGTEPAVVWDARELPGGNYVLKAVAEDLAGLTQTSTIDVTLGDCTYAIDPANASFTLLGGSGSIDVETTRGCLWTAIADVGWISFLYDASGIGPGTVTYFVEGNTLSPREGMITVAGLEVTVAQDGGGLTPTPTVGVQPTATRTATVPVQPSATRTPTVQSTPTRTATVSWTATRTATVTYPVPQVVYPNGGEVLTAGSTITVEWTVGNQVQPGVDLQYTTNSGVNWTAMASGVAGMSYEWSIPGGIDSSNCWVKVITYDGSWTPYTDQSDVTFTIVSATPTVQSTPTRTATVTWTATRTATAISPQPQVAYPNGGEVLTAGSTITVQWSVANQIQPGVDLQYTTNAGVSGSGVASGVAGNSTNWTIPAGIDSSACWVKVITYDSAWVAYTDRSDDTFTIVLAATPTSTPTPGTPVGDEVLVPAGEFQMGCDGTTPADSCDSYGDEDPVHAVNLDAYYIDTYEVTSAQYKSCVTAGSCTAANTGGSCTYNASGKEQHPINCVDHYQATAYCAYAGRRLPTEAEWEKAARGTDQRIFPWGDTSPDCTYANHDYCVGATTPVGSYPLGVSPYGAFDMAGNVFEWVSDWYDSGYYSQSPYQNPPGPSSGSHRVNRGGSWNFSATWLRSADRYWNYPTYWYHDIGFRCARTL
ncbi:MAG: SUMF1/EgtB/PvdO family nonheme iron enzyme [Candidatus Schekmanbacteria bacterium]|nr:SUMF1/EgtB/PvdO family nonheme iron enzyme [Candidatus Schekmanbacteria bacterium]